VFLIDQIRSIDTDYILGDPVDYLDWGTLADVELAVAHYLGLAERLRTAGHLGDAPRPRQDPRRSQ
jgi:hypothetical protein